ncbi:unnamed protein product, partial [Porites lobata]
EERTEDQLREKDKQVRENDEQLRRTEEQLRVKGEQLEINEKQLREKGKQVREKDEQLREKDVQLRETEEQLRVKEKHLKINEKQLQEKGKLVMEKDEQLRRTQEQLRVKEEQKQSLQRQLSILEGDKTRESAKFQEQLNIKVQELTDLRKELRDREQDNVVLEKDLFAAKEKLTEYESKLKTRDWVLCRDELQLSDESLGVGSFGRVVKGRYCGCVVAIKRLHLPTLNQRQRHLFEREMDIASRCRHPCLLQFIGATEDESPLFVTEIMETSLQNLLQKRKQKNRHLTETDIIFISLDVARALNYLHQRKPEPIVHRDVSSANVLLWKQNNQWRGKLGDYGTAKFLQETMTVAPGAMIYAAPEIGCPFKQTVKIDVFSFGVLFCEMCTGQLPEPERREEQVRLVTNKNFGKLILWCIEDDPDMRPSMEEIIEELEQLNSDNNYERTTQRKENSQRQLRETRQQLTNCLGQVSELQLSLSTAQQTISQLRSLETRDWVIPRDEIQITDECLGRGGWGSVNEGTYCGCTVAVKEIHELILSPHNIRRFEREMDIASKCRHPHLLQFIGATIDEGSPLFVTELMEKSLRALLEQRQLSETEIRVISLDVALALDYLHQKKPEPIIHRNVSSANVLLWRQGDQWRAKVSDYGTANFIQQTMTVAPGVMIYSAPEALTSHQTVKVDVYSFGALLCEMCMRELPDPTRREDQVVLVTNAVFRDLLRRCLQREPGTRPTMQGIIDELKDANVSS